MKPGTFFKPPDAVLVQDAEEAWEKYVKDCIAYPKMDGWRFQIHINDKNVALLSRGEEDYTDEYPLVIEQIVEQVGRQEMILDVEMVGYDANDQQLPPSQLRKAHHHRCWVLDIPVLSGQDMTNEPTVERLRQAENWLSNQQGSILKACEFRRFSDYSSWLDFFNRCLQRGLEGAILKIANKGYFTPVYKVKPFDTVDLIVLAGNRDKEPGGSLKNLLLGAPAENFRRIAIVGTTHRKELNDPELWEEIVTTLQPHSQDTRPQKVDQTPNIPTTWFRPRIVLEVEATTDRNRTVPQYTLGGEGKAGYQLKHIRVTRVRSDKGPEDATTEDKLVDRFKLPPVPSRKTAQQLCLFDIPPTERRGELEVIVGCMFSGKTTRLIRRIKELQKAGHGVAVFHPTIDTRSPNKYIETHDGLKLEATGVANTREIAQTVSERSESYIAIDEVQFFDEGIVSICLELIENGHQVITAGLDLDFRGVPFGPMPQLLSCADRIEKLNATCSVCGKPAFFSQRLPEGRPASFFEKIVVPGGDSLYQPRCLKHHTVPGKSLRLARTSNNLNRQGSQQNIWGWVQQLRAIGQTGLHFSNESYDRERYNDILELAAEMATLLQEDGNPDLSPKYQEWLLTENVQLGYVTPKVAVAVAVFSRHDEILLVQRADDELWALPGGWADVGYTAAENAQRELYQETGLLAYCDGLVGVYDGQRNRVGISEEALYTILFHAQLVDGKISSHRQEILEARFVKPDAALFQQLAGGSRKHVEDAINYHEFPNTAEFDRST